MTQNLLAILFVHIGLTDLQFLTSYCVTSHHRWPLRTANTSAVMKNIIAGRREISETSGVAYCFFPEPSLL